MLDSYLYLIILAAALLVGVILTLALKRRRWRAKPHLFQNLSPRTTSIHEVHKAVVVTPSAEGENDLVLSLRQNLLLKALGNASVVERLVAFERTKNPAGDQVQWLDAAIRQWERDNDRR